MDHLTSKNEWVRDNAVAYLANAIGHSIPRDDAKIALPLLNGFLRDTNAWVRSSAAFALKQIDR